MSKKFDFGKNWFKFSKLVDEQRIESAEHSLKKIININLKNKTFFDVGCGSGLFSLAALNLGANVTAIDVDKYSTQTTKNLIKKFYKGNNYKIINESILNEMFLKKIKNFDIVYSWGVLHHTGKMWEAIKICANKVKPGGKLVIAIYNDQGGASKRWLKIKQIYVSSPKIVRIFLISFFFLFFETRNFLIRLIRFQNPFPFEDWKKKERGMSSFYDLIDWIGGYPFEYSKPEDIFRFLKDKKFILDNLKTCAGGHGCNEFVFTKVK